MRESTDSALYDRHGDALFSLAMLLCQDVDRAVDVVAATVAQACATASEGTPDEERRRLAAALWHRCGGDTAASASRWDKVLHSRAHASGRSSEQEQSLLGLVLLGCHTYQQAAALIGVQPSSAARQLRSILRRAADTPIVGRA